MRSSLGKTKMKKIYYSIMFLSKIEKLKLDINNEPISNNNQILYKKVLLIAGFIERNIVYVKYILYNRGSITTWEYVAIYHY